MTDAGICSLALARLGRRAIQSLDGTADHADKCAVLYPIARDKLLRENLWVFARRQVALAVLDEDVDDFSYAYQYPTDCMLARKIWSATPATRIPFQVRRSSTGSRMICTDEEEAILVYTVQVTNPNEFDASFVAALSAYLAYQLAPAITGSSKMQADLRAEYYLALREALVSNAREGYRDTDQTGTNPLAEARL